MIDVNAKHQSGHEYSVCPDQHPAFIIYSAADKRDMVRDQLRTWHASRTVVGVSISHPPYDLTFLGTVVDVMNEGCFVENEKKDNLLSLSFENSICSMGSETIDGVTRLKVELRHLHSGITVQISEGAPVRKIRRCSGRRIGQPTTRPCMPLRSRFECPTMQPTMSAKSVGEAHGVNTSRTERDGIWLCTSTLAV
jgi:hypothetical protein